MIILDLTNARRSKLWPNDIPDKIRLIEGEHSRDYDLHPMVRNTKWYKKLCRTIIEKYPDKREDWPVGIYSWEIEERNAKLIFQ